MGRKERYVTVGFDIPAGKYCVGANYQCQFLQHSSNHPCDFCFFIPDFSFMNCHGTCMPKHPKCPANYELIPKSKSNETADVRNRLKILKDLNGEHS